MKIKSGKFFPYGVKVKGKKDLTNNCSIELMPAPEKVYISLSQHIGAPATPVVSVGDKVKLGQIIGEASGFISANVYSSVSGEVVAIDTITNGLNQKQTHVVIANDFKDEEVLLPPIKDEEPKTLIEQIRLAGIVGLGGAGFPTAVKLTPASPLDTLIINGAECEPYLTCDNRLMLEKTNEVYEGIKLVAKALGVSQIIFGIEKNKPQAIDLFSKYQDIQIVKLKKQYPMGSEKHLIYCTTGRKVPAGKMPFDVGCCVQNVKTVLACRDAIINNKPLTQTVMTVSGNGIKTPKNLQLRIGTPFNDIIEYCGGSTEQTVKLVAGGPMMGKALSSTQQFVRKTDSGLLVLTNGETDLSSPSNCINCARCAKNCPMRLMPMYIDSFVNNGDYEKAEKYGAMNCLECGSCAFGCPAKRPLVQSMAMAKLKIKEMKANGKK